MELAKAIKAVVALEDKGYPVCLYKYYFGFGEVTTALAVMGPCSENVVQDVPILNDCKTSTKGTTTIYY